MAIFDNNPLSALTNPVTSGIGSLFEGMTPFGSTIPGGILKDEDEAKLRNQALIQGLLGTAATYLATPKNLNAGSPLPYIGKAVLGGMGASQDVIDRAIRAKLLSGRDDNLYNVDGALVDKAGKVIYQSPTKQQKRDTAVVDGVVVDVNTGEPIYTSPKQQKLNTEIIDVGGKKILINKDTGAPIQEFIVTKPPAEPQTQAEIVKKNLTPLETEIDKKAADDLVQFTIGGGFSDVQKSLSQLNVAKESLKQTPEGKITGKLVGIQDDTGVLKYTNPNALNTKEQVQEIAQRNLRLILGAAFTQKEGDQLIARVYNPALPQNVNAQRLELLENQLLSAAKTKQEAVEYYNANGTLKGFKGKLYNNTSEFLNDYNDKLKGTNKTDATQKMPTTSGFTEGAKTKSKSGKPMIFRNGQWEYE
jgi:hypothetical protein